MEFTNLGRTGLKVSRLCLGMMSYGSKQWREWVLSEEEGRPFIQRAMEAGINFFDTANMYSRGVSEEVLEYVDLYQIHRFDPETPIEETVEALHDVVKAGKARYLGASSMYAWQFAKMLHVADQHGWTRFASMQNHYNLIYREEEREMIPLCRAEGIGVIPWSPLARGFLAGNRSRGGGGETVRSQTDDYAAEMYYQDADFAVADRAAEIARQRGVTSAQIALAWLLHKPGITAPIIGATKMFQLDEALAALELRLTDDEVEMLERPYVPHPVLGHS
jgi:aryl-alcohol dehydrogenase (NADP+)